MKKLTFTIILILSQVFLIAQTEDACLPEGIYFYSQEQIDNFQTNYPGCTEIEGDVTINGSNITNLNGLSVVTSIGGRLWIGSFNNANPLLENLTGLEGLTSIGESLLFGGNMALTSLTGLENLNSIGGGLYFGWSPEMPGMGNPLLSSLESLNSLVSIGGSLTIMNGNNSLTSLTGLEGLTSIVGNLYIFGNDSLVNLTGLENVTSIGEGLSIGSNNSLTSLTGLENVAPGSIGNLSVHSNSTLSNCAVESICEYLSSPNGNIQIYNNAPGCNSPEEVEEACLYLGFGEEENNKIPELKIYPSPVNDFATLQFHLDQPCSGLIEIFNTTGVCVQSRQLKMDKAGQQHLLMNFTAMSVGIYFCHVQAGNEIIIAKFIKN